MSENVGDWVARLRLRGGREIVWLLQADGSALAHLVTADGLIPCPELGIPDTREHLAEIAATLAADKEV